jgi:multiple sugar transport system ATP-binding protein/alpha-glucoside transport system ATP-binding protein
MIYVTHDQVEAMTLADKIVVLRDGRIEQVGAPIELYDRPANAFVAQFIGSPKMNFFEAGDLSKTAAKTLGHNLTSEQQVGLRPEHLQPVKSGAAVLEGKLELVENLGEYALVHLVTETGVEFIAKTEKPPKQKKGETIGFTIKPELAHYFEKASGLRI